MTTVETQRWVLTTFLGSRSGPQQPLICTMSARRAQPDWPLFQHNQISPTDEAWALWPPQAQWLHSLQNDKRRSESPGSSGTVRGSHTDFLLCWLTLFIYLPSGSKWWWGVDCNMQDGHGYKAERELGVDVLWRQRTQKMGACLFYLVPTKYSEHITLRHWQSAHPFQVPADRPSLPAPSIPPHLLSTFVWFSVIRSESLPLLLMHCGFYIRATHNSNCSAVGGQWIMRQLEGRVGGLGWGIAILAASSTKQKKCCV